MTPREPERTTAVDSEVAVITEPAARPCAKCRSAPRKSGSAYCDGCLDICHEAPEFDHCCMICATPEEAKRYGYRSPDAEMAACTCPPGHCSRGEFRDHQGDSPGCMTCADLDPGQPCLRLPPLPAPPPPSLAGLARQLVESYDQDGAAALARPDWARLAVAVLREVARGGRARPEPAVPAYTAELDGTENFGRANPPGAS